MSTPTIAERVAAGAAWLDEHEPGWHERIALNRLNILSACRCVLGQLDVNFWHFLAHHDLAVDDAERMGFDIQEAEDDVLRDDEADKLTSAWRDLITARRAAGGAA